MAGRSVINVLVNADTKDFVHGMDTAGRKVGGFVTGGLKNLAKLGAAFGAAGAAATVAFGKIAFDAAEAASTANARIEQIATSMDLFGGEVGAVTDRLVDLSEETARLTGVNQNTIKEAQALLLTFGEIASSADEAGGVFDRATQASLDLSAAGFGGVTDASKQLGKALNDPIKGISALSRSGVTFTEQEKELIKTLVESGDMLEAQDMILGAIEKQVGGTAEATANASDRIKVGFSQVTEQIGLALLPVFERLTGFVLDKVIPGIEKLADAFEEGGLRAVLDMVVGFIKSEGPKATNALWDWAKKLGEFLIGTALPWLGDKALQLGQALVDWIGPKIDPMLKKLGEFAEAAGRWLVDTGLPWLGEKLQELGQALVDWIGPRIRPMLSKLGDWIGAAAQWVLDDGVPMLVDKLVKLGDTLVAWIGPNIRPMLGKLGDFLVSILDWIVTEAVPKLGAQAVKLASALIGWAADLAPDLLLGLGELLIKIGTWVVTDGIPKLLSVGKDLAGGLLDGLTDALGSLLGRASGVAKDFVNAIIGFVNDNVIYKINDLLEFRIPLGFGKSISVNPPDIPGIPRLADGGLVTGPQLAIVGEAGPELVVPLDRAGEFGMGGGMNVTINMPAGSDGYSIVRVLEDYNRRRGSLPITTTQNALRR